MDIQEFKSKYPSTEVEQIEDVDYVEDEEGNEFPIEVTSYALKGIPNLGSLVLSVSQSDLDRLDAIVSFPDRQTPHK